VGLDLVERVREVVSTISPHPPAITTSALGVDAALFGSVYAAMEVAETQILTIAGSPGGLSGGGKRRAARR
jgi:hypothetical protein